MVTQLPPSPAPLYFRVAAAIEAAIMAGKYPIDKYLPNEKTLAAEFGVSLITLRAAMANLVDRGLVERRRGKGTLVVSSEMRTVWELGWLGDLITSVLASPLDVIKMGNVKASEWVALRLGVSTGDAVHHMRTVRRAVHRSNQPFMTTDLYHPKLFGSLLKKADFAHPIGQNEFVVMTLEKKSGIKISSVRQTMSAELADSDAQRLLGVDVGTPLLVVTRDYFSLDGQIVQTGRSRYRVDDYEYVLNLERTTNRRRHVPEGQKESFI